MQPAVLEIVKKFWVMLHWLVENYDSAQSIQGCISGDPWPPPQEYDVLFAIKYVLWVDICSKDDSLIIGWITRKSTDNSRS